MSLTKLQKEYCKINGWIKKKGILIDVTAVDSGYDSFFVPDECKEDYYKEKSVWCDKDGNDECVFDDDEIIDHIEDFAGMTFDECKERKSTALKEGKK